jgi:hypothetical protein
MGVVEVQEREEAAGVLLSDAADPKKKKHRSTSSASQSTHCRDIDFLFSDKSLSVRSALRFGVGIQLTTDPDSSSSSSFAYFTGSSLKSPT